MLKCACRLQASDLRELIRSLRVLTNMGLSGNHGVTEQWVNLMPQDPPLAQVRANCCVRQLRRVGCARVPLLFLPSLCAGARISHHVPCPHGPCGRHVAHEPCACKSVDAGGACALALSPL